MKDPSAVVDENNKRQRRTRRTKKRRKRKGRDGLREGGEEEEFSGEEEDADEDEDVTRDPQEEEAMDKEDNLILGEEGKTERNFYRLSPALNLLSVLQK